MHEILDSCEKSMNKRIEAFDKDLSRVRTGRASISILDGIRVDYYGTMTALNQVASLSAPDARTIVVSPFEKKLIGDIERAIQMADLGIQPTNDGNVVRLPVPQLTEERRKDIAKSLRKMAEDAKVGIRRVRQDSNERIKKLEKAKELGEDESKKLQKDIQNVTDKFIKAVDDRVARKEKEILTL